MLLQKREQGWTWLDLIFGCCIRSDFRVQPLSIFIIAIFRYTYNNIVMSINPLPGAIAIIWVTISNLVILLKKQKGHINILGSIRAIIFRSIILYGFVYMWSVRLTITILDSIYNQGYAPNSIKIGRAHV